MTPAARSLALLRSQGWVGDHVERWIGGAPDDDAIKPEKRRAFRVRLDYLHYADLTLIKGSEFHPLMALCVQSTTGTNIAARLAKMRKNPKALKGALDWLGQGGLIEIHGWAKRGKRGERKTWQVRILPVNMEMLGDGTT